MPYHMPCLTPAANNKHIPAETAITPVDRMSAPTNARSGDNANGNTTPSMTCGTLTTSAFEKRTLKQWLFA